MDNMIVLHQTPYVLVAQTTVGDFDKLGNDTYGSFNVALHVGDKSSAVLQNRAKLLQSLNQFGKVDAIYWLNQVHGNVVLDIDASTTMAASMADAFITKQSGQALAIMTADCVPVAIFHDELDDCDDYHGAPVACIHAGWQGLTSGVIFNTVFKMQSMSNMPYQAVIGAHISQDNYEITRTLANKIIASVCGNNNKLVGIDANDLYDLIIKNSQDDDKCLIDLNQLTRLQLEYLGVKVVNDASPCSYQDVRFYSYRAQTHAKKFATGRMATIIVKL